VNVEARARVVSEEWRDEWIEMTKRMTLRYVGNLDYLEARLKFPLSVISLTPVRTNTRRVTSFPPDRTLRLRRVGTQLEDALRVAAQDQRLRCVGQVCPTSTRHFESRIHQRAVEYGAVQLRQRVRLEVGVDPCQADETRFATNGLGGGFTAGSSV